MFRLSIFPGVMMLGVTGLSFPINAQSDGTRQTVTSEGPSSVSVTIYRNPNRAAANDMNLQYLGGYALVTEQRTVDLPAGEVDLRFEGVAGGIIPQSAIVTGLTEDVLEKNRDAALLSPSALLNANLGRRVTIRRTMAATGEVREFDADIRTDASGGMVVQTADGFEALKCTGLNEAIIYDEIPEGLSAKPTLSVKSRIRQPTRATVTLSYLATGFDWQANYVADVSDDGEVMDLFAWVTLANADETSFINAQTQTVAGQPNKGRDNIAPATGGGVALRCWPSATTSDIQLQEFERARSESRFAGAPLPSPMMAMEAEADMVVVTGVRKVRAQQEDLGDLKLYRIPVPVTVASKSQKQVAFLEKSSVPFKTVYEAEVYASGNQDDAPFANTIRFLNEKKSRLGEPLPAGKLAAFRTVNGARLLVGQGSLEDKAIGEEVDVVIGSSPLVRYKLISPRADYKNKTQYRYMELTVTNASPRPATIELKLQIGDETLSQASQKLGRKDGSPAWKLTLPANSERVLTYRTARRE